MNNSSIMKSVKLTLKSLLNDTFQVTRVTNSSRVASRSAAERDRGEEASATASHRDRRGRRMIMTNTRKVEAQNKYGVDEFVLTCCFHRHVTNDGVVIYWRSCVVQDGIRPDEVGYMILYEDGNHLHTYRRPDNL